MTAVSKFVSGRLKDLFWDNPDWAIDVFDELDLARLGFSGVEPERQEAGLLSGDIVEDRYGYLNRMESSRRLERECRRNIELIWLISITVAFLI